MPSSAAIKAATRAGQPSQTSRSWRARRNQGDSARPVDQFALLLLQLHPPQSCLQHLIGGARRHEVDLAFGAGQSLFAQRLTDRAEGSLRHRPQ